MNYCWQVTSGMNKREGHNSFENVFCFQMQRYARVDCLWRAVGWGKNLDEQSDIKTNKQLIGWNQNRKYSRTHTHTRTHVKGSHFLINEHTRAELFTITPGRQSFAPMQSKTARPEVPSPSDDCSLHWHCIKLLDKHKINCKNKTQTHRSKTILNWSNECATKP